MSQYRTYGKVQIEGTQDYVAGVTGCLDVIDSIPDGRKLLQQICAKAHTVTMQDTTSGNACAAQEWSAFPLMLLALKDKQVVNFKSELSVAIYKAKTGGLTLEHLARQLSTGEVIHALHNSSGINMALAKKNNENIEELITTGMPPYNFEELSDNKMRTQWPSHLHLRQDY